MNSLVSVASMPSTERRIQIFGSEIPFLLADIPSNSGNEEVEMACSSSLTSWVARSARAFQLDVISCIASDLKKKGAPRMGYLHFLQSLSFHCVRGLASSSGTDFNFTIGEDGLAQSDLWEKPPTGFYKLNTDVTFDFSKNSGHGCGVLRDSGGRVVKTFLEDFEDATVDDVTLFELRAMAGFVEQAYNHLVTEGESDIKLILEGDCLDAFVAYEKYKKSLTENKKKTNLGKPKPKTPPRFVPLCRRIHQVETRCSQFRAVHVKRTHNSLADLESKYRADKLKGGENSMSNIGRYITMIRGMPRQWRCRKGVVAIAIYFRKIDPISVDCSKKLLH